MKLTRIDIEVKLHVAKGLSTHLCCVWTSIRVRLESGCKVGDSDQSLAEFPSFNYD